MKWFFALIFIFFAEYNYAQNTHFEWVNPENTLRERIEINTQNYYKEVSPSVWKLARKLSIDVAIFKDLPPNNAKSYFYLDKGKNIWFTVNGTGLVYQFTPSSRTFVRLDHTFYRGYNFFAHQFVRNNKLYSLGGEGFWAFSKVLTYFNVDKKEWEVVRNENFGPEIINFYGYHGLSEKEDLIFSGGTGGSHHVKDMKLKFDDRLFVYDFKTAIWKVLGHINPVLPYQTTYTIFWDGKHFFHFCIDKLYLIEPIDNTIYLFEDENQSFIGSGKYYKKGDTIYNYHDNGINISKFSKNEMLKKAKYMGPFYTEDTPYTTFLIGFLLLISGGVMIYFYAKRKKKFTKSFNGIFENVELKLINSLIVLGEDDYLTNNEMNDVLGISGKSQENQRKIKMNLINQINQKIDMKYQVKDAICRISISEDKRLKAYYMKKEVVKLLRK